MWRGEELVNGDGLVAVRAVAAVAQRQARTLAVGAPLLPEVGLVAVGALVDAHVAPARRDGVGMSVWRSLVVLRSR